MRKYAVARDWLTIIQLSSYTPDLNRIEGVWSLLRRRPLANTAFTDDEHFECTLRRGLRHIQLHRVLALAEALVSASRTHCSPLLDDGSLVIEDLPLIGNVLPDRRPPCSPPVEDQGVRQEIQVSGQLPAME